MPDDAPTATVRVVRSIHDITPAEWDACAGDSDPFVTHAFLSCLEDSGSAVDSTGWAPHHLALQGEDGRMLGCMPFYLKGHSFGEYVFDHAWADAMMRAGGDYYPKLQCSVPFTPVTGPRLLVHPDAPDRRAAKEALGDAAAMLCRRNDLSSVHITFLLGQEAELLEARGWLTRIGQQYHWHNRGYATFDDFLADLSSRKRKQIRRERRVVAENGVKIHTLRGDEITPEHWEAFFGFYMDTGSRKWGTPYLTREFFDLLGERLADRVVLIMAESDGHWVAGALNFLGTEAIYGRNWGCDAQMDFLHFELCYYRAIDFAISTGLPRVEAGAQGEHKIQRGYTPVRTCSAHFIADPGFHKAVADYVRREARYVEADMEALVEMSPFRKQS